MMKVSKWMITHAPIIAGVFPEQGTGMEDVEALIVDPRGMEGACLCRPDPD